MFSSQYMILFQACLNDNQAQARNGQAACNYKEVMDHLKVTLNSSIVVISRLHSLVTGRSCQARAPGTSPADGEPLECREASRDGPACDPEGVGGLEKGHRSGDGSAAATTAAEQQQQQQEAEVQARPRGSRRPRWRPRRRQGLKTSMAGHRGEEEHSLHPLQYRRLHQDSGDLSGGETPVFKTDLRDPPLSWRTCGERLQIDLL